MIIKTTKHFKAGAIFIVTGLSLSLNAANYTDMVYVDSAQPFYIKIFEASFNDEIGRSSDSKPARMDFSEAKAYCKRIGLRLPTMAEWLFAATNLNKNIHHTLIGDSLNDSSGNLQVNIQKRLGGSAYTKQFNNIGIDAIGTVGMTGNRPEWVLGPSGSEYKCGGAYETQDTNDVHLTRICKSKNDGYATRTGTSRCVTDFDSSITIPFSKYVTGKLQVYLATINDGFNNKPGSSNVIAHGVPMGANSISMDQLDIDDNESDFN